MIVSGQTPQQRIEQLEDLLNQAQALINQQRAEIRSLERDNQELSAVLGNHHERLENLIARIEGRCHV